MKTNRLINPFERIAGWHALAVGVCVMALTAVFGKINGVAFSGAIDVRAGEHGFPAAFVMQAVNLLVVSLMMWLAGICFSKSKVRIVDIVGTMALSRAPMLLLVIICFLPVVPSSRYDIPRLIVFCIIGIILIIWMIALMYNAFSVSCRIKGSRRVISFIGALILAEIASVCIFMFLLGSLFINPESGSSSKSSDTNITENITVADITDIRQTAEKVVKAFEEENFDVIIARFDDKMKKGLPKSGLKMTWLQLTGSYGKFDGADMENVKESITEDYSILLIPFAFEKGKLNLQLTFNKEGQISGMYIKP